MQQAGLIKIIRKAFVLLSRKEQNRLKLLTLFNIIISMVDIVLLAMLLGIVSLYSDSNNQIVQILPSFLSNSQSLFPVVIFFGFFVLKSFIAFLVFQAQSKLVFKISSRLAREQLLRYLSSSYDDYTHTEQAQLVNLANNTPIEFARHILTGIQVILTETVLAIIVIIAILILNTPLFLLLILFLFPPVLLAAFLVKKKLRNVKDNVQKDGLKANQYLNEAFNSYIESYIYDKKLFFADKHYTFQNKLNNHLAQQQIAQWIPSKLVELFAVLGLFILIVINNKSGYSSDMINIGAFIAAAYKIIPGMVRIANMNALIRTYEYTITELLTEDKNDEMIINTESEIDSIEACNISFAYSDKLILNNINTKINRGDFVWVSGASGRGKSTFVNLLLGFLEPQEGAFLINNTIMTAAERRSFHHLFSYVKQQTFLIHDTILSNITLTEKEYDTEKLHHALAHSGLQPFIDKLPGGVGSMLSNGGKNISGGQRQRIAIARALYKNADIIILDEPFNELDEQSEKELLGYFRQQAATGKIVILLSHSSVSSSFCNKIISIEK